MAIKKITLTEDHIKLIQNIKFETFEMGELFSTVQIDDAIEEIERTPKNFEKFGILRDFLKVVREKLELLSERKECHAWGINQWSLFGGTYVFEDIAMILGKYNQYIPGTEESPLGKQYPKELEDYMWTLYGDIFDNMEYIISLMQFYTDKGGLTPGTYKCRAEDKIWTKLD